MTFQIKETPEIFDVVIVGSGAGGGMAAYTLTKAGAKVCLLEAGSYYDPADPQYITQMKNPWESPRRGASSTRPFGDFDAAWGGWDIEGEPYTAAQGTQFRWFRSRMLGGRTNHWGRISLRFGPDDFKRKSIDGLGDDWPIGYDDVKPYYDKVDKMIGLFGTKEGIRNEPDGHFLPPPKPRLHELMLKKAATGIGIPVIPSRMAMLTKPINDSRGACYYCGQCGLCASLSPRRQTCIEVDAQSIQLSYPRVQCQRMAASGRCILCIVSSHSIGSALRLVVAA